MQRISNKSKDKLYSEVYDDITRARTIINMMLKGSEFENDVDHILFNLSVSAPKKAINCFDYKKEK